MKLVLLVLLFHPYRVSLLRAIKVTAGAAMPFVNFRDEITMVSFLWYFWIEVIPKKTTNRMRRTPYRKISTEETVVKAIFGLSPFLTYSRNNRKPSGQFLQYKEIMVNNGWYSMDFNVKWQNILFSLSTNSEWNT